MNKRLEELEKEVLEFGKKQFLGLICDAIDCGIVAVSKREDIDSQVRLAATMILTDLKMVILDE